MFNLPYSPYITKKLELLDTFFIALYVSIAFSTTMILSIKGKWKKTYRKSFIRTITILYKLETKSTNIPHTSLIT
jgi:hypothetical protein